MANSKHVLRNIDTSSRIFFVQTLTSYYIPDDLIMNILPRLPVKSLLRFKTVSKHWRSLISDPAFVNSHLRHALENNETLIIHSPIDFYNSSIGLFHVDSSIDLPYFEGELSRNLLIVGSYNGIVCVALNNGCSARDLLICLHPCPHLYLWNPATKKSNLLPPLCPVKEIVKVYVGFGFDPIANDFKVVRIGPDIEGVIHAMVYSTNANAWKGNKRPGILPCHSFCDACVNGVLYWRWDHGVIRYDLNNEVFYDHRFPANVLRTREGKILSVRIMEMKDSIAVITYSNYTARPKTKVNLWTVDDGFERSWTLRYSFDVASKLDWVHGYINNNGDILYSTRDGVWLLHNLVKNEAKNVTVPVRTRETFKHTESLVPIRGSVDLVETLIKHLKLKH